MTGCLIYEVMTMWSFSISQAVYVEYAIVFMPKKMSFKAINIGYTVSLCEWVGI